MRGDRRRIEYSPLGRARLPATITGRVTRPLAERSQPSPGRRSRAVSSSPSGGEARSRREPLGRHPTRIVSPSGAQSASSVPPRSRVMLRRASSDPKPSVAGAPATGAPPRSVQTSSKLSAPLPASELDHAALAPTARRISPRSSRTRGRRGERGRRRGADRRLDAGDADAPAALALVGAEQAGEEPAQAPRRARRRSPFGRPDVIMGAPERLDPGRGWSGRSP